MLGHPLHPQISTLKRDPNVNPIIKPELSMDITTQQTHNYTY